MKYSLIRFYVTGAQKVMIRGLPKRKAQEVENLLNDELDVTYKLDRDEPCDYYGMMPDDSAVACYGK